MMESFVYFPFGNATPLDLLNPLKLFKILTGMNGDGQKNSDELTLGLYAKSSVDFKERENRYALADIR